MSVAPHQTGHRARLKARLKKDAAQLADYEILELLLGCVVLRRDTKALAKTLLQRFDTMRGVLDARPDELMSLEGFGPALGLFWRLLRELMARYEEAPARRREVLCTPDAVARMARARLAACPHEELWIALTDHGNRLIAWERLRQGTVGHVPLTPRDVLETALLHKASNIILVHNHPGGSARPSGPDLLLTRELAGLASALGITLVDHVVVTEDACYSIDRDRLL
jgi:DNA repair protein RadC